MEVTGEEKVRRTQSAIGLTFRPGGTNPSERKKKSLSEVWEAGRRETFAKGLEGILVDFGVGVTDGSETFGRLKNLAIRMGAELICVGKHAPRGNWLVTVGYDGLFAGARGQWLKETGQTARRLWVDELYQKFLGLGGANQSAGAIVEGWMIYAESTRGEALTEAMGNESWRTATQIVPADILPDRARACTEQLLNDDCAEAVTFRLASWLVIRRLYRTKNKRRNHLHLSRVEATEMLTSTVEKRCTLRSGLCASKIFKGGRREWARNGTARVLPRVEAGVRTFGVLGYDSKGDGAYRQLAWVGDHGLEAAVLGPRFFPPELARLMSRDGVYVVGVRPREEVSRLCDGRPGLRVVDLSLLARDLPTNDHSRSDMGSLILESTGTNVDHIELAGKGRFLEVRTYGWGREVIGAEKTVYAAMGATMIFPVMFDAILFWISRYANGDIYGGGAHTWEVLLDRILGPLVNRVRKAGAGQEVAETRDILLHTAALAVSEYVPDI